MSVHVLLGLEFDGEYDPRVRAELEQIVATIQTWQHHVPPNDAEYVVGALSDDLTNERLVTDSSTIAWNLTVAGQISASTIGMATTAATYLTATDEHVALPSSRQLIAGTNITFDDTVANQRTVSASGSGGGHLHGLTRLAPDGVATTFNLLDVAEYLEHIEDWDPLDYTLSSDGTQVTFRYAPFLGMPLTMQYVIASL